ncbi:MAG: ABC transporter permease [Tissierellia bacterium]|nr:ABC transporter permease [Tissierellia bacterium]
MTAKPNSKNKGQSMDVLRRLFRSKGAVVGLVIITVLLIFAIFADFIAPFGYDDQLLSRRLQAPSSEHLLGTDDYGRDIFSRIVYGSRTSLLIALLSVAFSSVIGVAIGCIAGYYGGRTDNAIMRFIDILLAIPSILLAISISAALDPGVINLVVAVGIGAMPPYARIVRASVMSERDKEYIEAARSIGANDFRVLIKHVLPNVMAPIIVQSTMSISTAIITAASLSFIGLGIAPPTPEWGSMLSAGRAYIRDAWWVVTFPGLAIMSAVFGFNLLGDGLRDALDPKLKN